MSQRPLTFRFVSDTVMGGVSRGSMTRESVQGREVFRLRGTVSLENNGGFIQMTADIADGEPFDARAFSGLAFEAQGNGETYNIHLRTTAITRPWQSYRQSFVAGPDWRSHTMPFADFVPHRIDTPLDVRSLRRIGVLAIGREMEADVAVAGFRFV